MVSNEHPEVFDRLPLDPDLAPPCREGRRGAVERGDDARHVGRRNRPDDRRSPVRSSPDRTASRVGPARSPTGPVVSWSRSRPLGTVNGTLVLAPGDVNLTFKEYVRTPIRCTVVDDYITAIDGEGLDRELFASYLAAWDEPEAYAVSHVGWGLNHHCRWDVLPLYDKGDINGTELRAFAGNFLYSAGANEVAGRYASGTLRSADAELHDRARWLDRGRRRPARSLIVSLQTKYTEQLMSPAMGNRRVRVIVERSQRLGAWPLHPRTTPRPSWAPRRDDADDEHRARDPADQRLLRRCRLSGHVDRSGRSSSRRPGWEPDTDVVVADLEFDHEPLEIAPRSALKRAVEAWQARGLRAASSDTRWSST